MNPHGDAELHEHDCDGSHRARHSRTAEQQHQEEQRAISISPPSRVANAARAHRPFNFTTVVLSCVANAARHGSRAATSRRTAHNFNFTTVACCQCSARALAIHIPLASAPPRTHAMDDEPARTPGAPSHTLARVQDACLAVARVASRVRAIWRQEVDCM